MGGTERDERKTERQSRQGNRRWRSGRGIEGGVGAPVCEPGALLRPSLATMVSWESDQRLGVIGPAHSCHTVTTTGRPRDTDTDRGTEG